MNDDLRKIWKWHLSIIRYFTSLEGLTEATKIVIQNIRSAKCDLLWDLLHLKQESINLQFLLFVNSNGVVALVLKQKGKE
jgi:hypothetical protein